MGSCRPLLCGECLRAQAPYTVRTFGGNLAQAPTVCAPSAGFPPKPRAVYAPSAEISSKPRTLYAPSAGIPPKPRTLYAPSAGQSTLGVLAVHSRSLPCRRAWIDLPFSSGFTTARRILLLDSLCLRPSELHGCDACLISVCRSETFFLETLSLSVFAPSFGLRQKNGRGGCNVLNHFA